MKKIYYYHSCAALADHIATQSCITSFGMSFKDNSQLKKIKKDQFELISIVLFWL